MGWLGRGWAGAPFVDAADQLVMMGLRLPAARPQVSVLERLNPGGAYLTRVHRLNHFARAGQLVLHDRCLLVSRLLSLGLPCEGERHHAAL